MSLVGYLLSAAAGSYITSWVMGSGNKFEIARIESGRAEDQDRYLEVLRRELANLILVRAPERMVAAYEAGMAFHEAVQNVSSNERQSKMQQLSQKYPDYRDFDLLEVRHFIPYDSAAEGFTDDDIVERYTDITNWLSLCSFDERASSICRSLTPNSRELTILQRTVSKQFDQRFYDQAKEAMRRYWMRSDVENGFEDDFCAVGMVVRHVGPSAEYGVHLKELDSYALVALGEDVNSNAHIYRTDSNYENEVFIFSKRRL